MISGGFKDAQTGIVPVSHAAGDDAWTVHSWPGGSSLTTYAYCSKHRNASSAHKKVTVKSEKNHVATAKCDSGDAVAGGWSFKPQVSNSPVFRTRRAGSSNWNIQAVLAHASPTNPEHLTAYAYCAKHTDVKVRTATHHVGANAPGSVTAHCHRGEELLSGGYASKHKPDWGNTTGPDFFVFQDARKGMRAWKVSAFNNSDVGDHLIAYAYCAS